MPIDFPYRTRRTLKPEMMDESRPIDRATLLEILEDANWAPTHGRTQPWRFHIYTGSARAALGDALVSIYDRITLPPDARPEKREKLRASPQRAPVVIAVAAHVPPDGNISMLDELCASACAVENILLSAHQRGLGSFWSSAPAACSQEFLQWLGLDYTHHALGLVYLGFAKPGTTATSNRLPISERVTFHGELP